MRFLPVSPLRNCLGPFWQILGLFSLASSDSRVFIEFTLCRCEADERLGCLVICNHNIDLRLTSIQPFTSLYPHETPDIWFNFCLNTQSNWHTKLDLESKPVSLGFYFGFPAGGMQQDRVLRICVQQGEEPSEQKSSYKRSTDATWRKGQKR